MKVNEIFTGIQGEGKYAGTPALFIRLSGCNLECPWCDTKYHKSGQEMDIEIINNIILNSKLDTVIWTGGEPTLQLEEIEKVIEATNNPFIHHQIETNGTIKFTSTTLFQYICFSPKNKISAINITKMPVFTENDIKVVTDMETVGVDLIPYATMLMPLTTFEEKKDNQIKQKVWNYCIKNGLKYSPRLHVDLWGAKRGK